MCSDSVYRCDCDTSDITGEQHTGGACQCSTDHCIDPTNTDNGVCSGRGNCSVCEPPERACSCKTDYEGLYCERVKLQGEVGHCDDSGSVKECVTCYGDAAKENTEPSCNCTGYTKLDYRPESYYDVPDSLADTTVDCSFIGGECRYMYFVGRDALNQLVYAVEPPLCLPIPSWVLSVIILVGMIMPWIMCVLPVVVCFIKYCKISTKKKPKESVNQDNPMYNNPVM